MKNISLIIIAMILASCSGEGSQSSSTSASTADAKVYRWKMITTWPKNLPGLGTAPERLAQKL